MFACVCVCAFLYQLVLSSDLQSVVGIMLQMAKFLIDMMGKLLPSINRLQDYLVSIDDLNLVANSEFRSVSSALLPLSLSGLPASNSQCSCSPF